ncbi:WcaI family glycosyltransferase [Novosphingobium terrae]|uniref:WcaI family glycosyltransferase n=1 Tax=Novosphingobium terrae TaxID=2726189 RepID=UPI00197D5F3F|nr:WcaI family glycosyltransferase [Novosphingobium terrae]
MKILILGLNYAPEPVGIGPYTTGMAEFLAQAGHQVSVVCGKAYYPHWRLHEDHRARGVLTSAENGVRVNRVPIYVPEKPNGLRRLLHHISFAASAGPVMAREAWRARPDMVICIAPSLISTVVARAASFLTRAKLWLHIQDFEVEAAFATGLLKDGGLLASAARAFERWSLKATRISTISPQMCAKLRRANVPSARVVEFRNWANIDHVRPLDTPSSYREIWDIKTPYVALYSGNIGNKQGIEIIVEVARLLRHRDDITFIICGNGAMRETLVEAARDLTNVRFPDLQPMEMMSQMLGLATVHLLPQIGGAADLVLPSKLTNMLASGRPVVATAEAHTGLAKEVQGCGLVVPPENAPAFAAAVETLLGDEALRREYGQAARARAEERWSKPRILHDFELALRDSVIEGVAKPAGQPILEKS